MELARVRRASIFGCEGHALYHSSRSLFQKWKSTDETTLVNTGSFVKVWDRIREDGLYALHDWTVKVDADCVFFPARLRTKQCCSYSNSALNSHNRNIDKTDH